MKRFYKSFTAIIFAAVLAIQGAVVYGDYALPDKVSAAVGYPDLGGIYSLSAQTALDASALNDDEMYTVKLKVLNCVPVKDVTVSNEKRRYVGLGGDIFGIKLYTRGAVVVEVDGVTTASGNSSPANAAGIKSGDVITHADSVQIINADSLVEMIDKSQGKSMKLTVNRNGSVIELTLKPALDATGRYRAGLWVRDSSAGVGTVTYYDDAAGYFAGLGHAVCDVDTGEVLPLSNGEALKATVNGFYKSSAGDPGELCGVFSDVVLGSLRVNCKNGVFSELRNPSGAKLIPVATPSEVREGYAQVVATVDGEGPKYYDAQILNLNSADEADRHNLVIQITDKELLAKTGGILQGMSGSPIIQNSMLVGAVTHVFINDPTKGYGIYAANMIDAGEEVF